MRSVGLNLVSWRDRLLPSRRGGSHARGADQPIRPDRGPTLRLAGRAQAARHPGDRGLRRDRRGRELRGHRPLRALQAGLAAALPRALRGGIPSHDTFRRVLMLLDPERFERCFLGWVRSVFRPDAGAPRQIAIDGKTVRRSFDRRNGRSPLHLVSAFAVEHGLVLAQRATDAKRGELTVLPDLLEGLDLRGCLVSLDALACRSEIAGQIAGRGGDYLLALKGNQKKVHAEVRRWFEANAFSLGGSLRPCCDAFEDGHGRLVRRRVFACTELEPLATVQRWRGLTAVLAIENIRGINGSGKVTAEIRYYLSSSELPPAQLAAAIRSHWAIENRLHWVLDVGFNEDASRVRERTAARNLALLRKIALNFVRANTT